MSDHFHHTITGVPDLDQRWDLLPNNGKAYCVPAATTDWMYYLAKHGRPEALKYHPADTDNAGVILANLAAMANYMDTDPEDGTDWDDGLDGLEDWLNDHHLPAFITAQRVPDGDRVTFDDLKGQIQLGALVIVSIGFYKRDDDEFERDGGHAVALVGLDRDGDRRTLTFRDPDDDPKRLNSQSAPASAAVAVHEELLNIEGDVVKILRWGTDTAPRKIVDGFKGILPKFALTNRTSTDLVSYRADLKTGQIDTRCFSLPVTGELLDMAIHPLATRAAVITRSAHNIWLLDLVEGSWSKTARVDGAQYLTFDGRKRRLFVVRGREILSFDDEGAPLGSLDTGAVLDAISYDQKNNRLIVVSTSSERIIAVAPDLKIIGHIESPKIPGTGRLSLSVNGRDATMLLTRHDSGGAAWLRWHSTGAVATGHFRLLANGATSASHIDRRGRLHTIEDGKIATFDSDGDRIGSLFDGLGAGTLLKVARTNYNFDIARSRRREWKNRMCPARR